MIAGEERVDAKLRKRELASHDVLDTLAVRGTTHGDYGEDSAGAMLAIELMMSHPGWKRLPAFAKHSLIMQEVKKARILAGNWDFADHWHDIAGYAKLVEEKCEK